MNIDQQLVEEIRKQLDGDILNFAWMMQIARLQRPGRSETDLTDAVLASVIKLHDDGTIVVGNAFESNGTVLIDAWPEANEDFRARIESETAKYGGSHDQAFCFWIQLVEHYAR